MKIKVLGHFKKSNFKYKFVKRGFFLLYSVTVTIKDGKPCITFDIKEH